MVTIVKYILSFILIFTMTAVWGQKPKQATVKPVVEQNSKLPKLTSSLGILTDSATIPAEEAVQLIKLPLKVTDDKKNAYGITSYRVIYKRKAVTEDEETGKVSAVMSNVSELFGKTPLTPIWINTLTEQLVPGEELYFFDIVAKDTQGRLMFAPDLRIKIK